MIKLSLSFVAASTMLLLCCLLFILLLLVIDPFLVYCLSFSCLLLVYLFNGDREARGAESAHEARAQRADRPPNVISNPK